VAEALALADIVCVLVRHRPFIEAVEDIRRQGRVIDAVGLLA
jgi:UDP-N-acetyl-D-mannosaminuronic acid dehydrogenase